MAFLRKWKINYKHKKFNDEDWGLEKNLNDLSAKNDHNGATIEHSSNDISSYDIKYLGCTQISSERTEQVTSAAINSVIDNSKGGRIRNRKTHPRVKLNISPQGIEVVDFKSGDSMLKMSIYKISYCSVHAEHDHAFSFVGSENDDEQLSCHVFMCAKRRIAHEITLTVAKCFQKGFQHWRDEVERQVSRQRQSNSESDGSTSSFTQMQESDEEIDGHGHQQNLLIDFTPEFQSGDFMPTVRDFGQTQNAWVVFEEDPGDSRQFIAC